MRKMGVPVKSQISRVSSSGQKSAVKGAVARIRAKALSAKKIFKAEEKDTRRCQKAVDKEMAKA